MDVDLSEEVKERLPELSEGAEEHVFDDSGLSVVECALETLEVVGGCKEGDDGEEDEDAEDEVKAGVVVTLDRVVEHDVGVQED